MTDTTVTRRRRGPAPGTTGRPAADVAYIARTAHADGRQMAQAVADAYNISTRAATAAITRARKAGHDIPYDFGYTLPDGSWCQGTYDPETVAKAVARRSAILSARATRARRNTDADELVAILEHSLATRAPKPRTQTRPGHIDHAAGADTPRTCGTCGHTAPSVWDLAGHTLDAHGRPPTQAERATEVAA